MRTFRQQALRDPAYSSQFGVAQVVVLVFVFVVIGFLFLGVAGVIVSMVASSAARGLTITTAVSLLFPLLFIAAFAIIVVIAVRGARWGRSMGTVVPAHHVRGSQRADLLPGRRRATYPGAIFISGRSRSRSITCAPPPVGSSTTATTAMSAGSGKNSTTHNWGFVALSLDRALPHMVLDSRSNNGLFGGTNLPTVFSKDQVLSLEGGFDTHFTLYCPREYERDALYVFTPISWLC